MGRCIALFPLVLALEASARVASAQSPLAKTCRASEDRKAVVARVVDARTGTPVPGLLAQLVAPRPDTIVRGDTTEVFPVLRRRPRLDASGQFCFENLRAGEYRFETSAIRSDASEQAIIVRLNRADSLKSIILRYRPFGRSPEDKAAATRMLKALDDNRRRWLSSRPAHYLVQVKHECASCVFAGPPHTYEIVNDVAVATIDNAGVRHALGEKARSMTVDSVFDALQASILDERFTVRAIDYDHRFGWPRQYETDRRAYPELSGGYEKVTVERFDVIR